MDEDGTKLIAWLHSLPTGATIRWCSIHVPPEEPWGRKYVDVTVIGYRPDQPGSWIYTIESPRRAEEAECSWSFRYDYDLDIHAVSNADVSQGEFAAHIPVPCGTVITPEQDQILEAALAVESGRRRGVVGAWSPEQISRALDDWCRRHAGRTDVHFIWDREADFETLFPELFQNLEEVEFYQLGPQVQASDQVMDFLLEQESEDAALLTSMLASLADFHFNGHYDPFVDE